MWLRSACLYFAAAAGCSCPHPSPPLEPTSASAHDQTQVLVPSDNCLTPERGVYDPTLQFSGAAGVHAALKTVTTPQLQVLIVPSFTSPRVLGLERNDTSYSLQLLQLRVQAPGLESDDRPQYAIERSARLPVDSEFARGVLELWRTTLNRTRYPVVRGMGSGKLDGVRYHLWGRFNDIGGRSGYTQSPMAGSYLAQLAEFIELMATATADGGGDFDMLRGRMNGLLERARKAEPCEYAGK